MIPRNALAGSNPVMPPSPSGPTHASQPQGSGIVQAIEQGIALLKQGQISEQQFMQFLMTIAAQQQMPMAPDQD